jgi:hypothetical protein
MDESFAAMDKFTDMEEATPAAPPDKPAPQKTPPKPPVKAPVKAPPKTEPPKPDEQPPKPDEEEVEKPEEVEAQKTGQEKGQRVKPWDLVEKFKTKNAQLEKELAEYRTKAGSQELPKEALDKINTLETRNKELEDEIRFVSYSKSKDFQENFQKPYQEAWQRAITELQELQITEQDGSTRMATESDLISLATMPLGQARKLAKEWFGEAVEDVIAHRRTVRELYQKQQKALEDARKNGGEREKQATIEQQAKAKAQADRVTKEWDSINSEAVSKYEFLRPVEGQNERNERLEKATKFVDDSFGLSVHNAKTEQERQEILQRHSALRNRAIGFSVLKHENKTLRAELEELKKSLAEFQTSEPSSGEAGHERNGAQSTDPMAQAMNDLANMAE